MPLEFQNIEVPLTGGLNTKDGEFNLPAGQLTEAENVEYTKENKLEVRNGTAMMPNFSSGIFSLKSLKMFEFEDKLFIFDGQHANIMSPSGGIKSSFLSENIIDVDVTYRHIMSGNASDINSSTPSEVTVVQGELDPDPNNSRHTYYIFRSPVSTLAAPSTSPDFMFIYREFTETKNFDGVVHYAFEINTFGTLTGSNSIRAFSCGNDSILIIFRFAIGIIRCIGPFGDADFNDNLDSSSSPFMPPARAPGSIFSTSDANTGATGGLFDAIIINKAVDPANNEYAIVYATETGFRLRAFDLNGFIPSKDVSVTATITTALTLFMDNPSFGSKSIYVCYSNDDNISYATFDSATFSTVAGPGVTETITGVYGIARITGTENTDGSHTAKVFIERYSLSPTTSSVRRVVTKQLLSGLSIGLSFPESSSPDNIGLLSNAFSYPGLPSDFADLNSDRESAFYGGGYNIDLTQSTAFLMLEPTIRGIDPFWAIPFRYLTGRGIVSRNAIGELNVKENNLTGRNPISQIAKINDTTFNFAVSTLDKLNDDGTAIIGVGCIEIKFKAKKMISLVKDQNACYINAGMLYYYDGLSLATHGFNWYPTLLIDNTVPNGLGTILYTAVYEWTDGNGRIWQSAPAVSHGVNSSISQPSLLFYTNYGFDGKSSEVKTVIYRTTVNGSVFYRIGAIDTDAALQENQILYTEGGELPNNAIPSPRYICKKGDRLYALVNDNELWFTKQDSFNSGPQFSNSLSLQVGSDTTDLTSMAALDDKLIIFSEDNTFLISGDGPSITGQGEFFGPQQISSQVGCLDVQSPISTEMGAFFKSKKGIYLLDRGLNFINIGHPVETFNDREIAQSVMVQEKNQLRFLLMEPTDPNHDFDSPTPSCLVYDFNSQKWTTFNYRDTLSIASLSGGTVYNGLFMFCGYYENQFFQETTDLTIGDNNNPIPVTISTGYMNFQNISSYKRLKQIGFTADAVSGAFPSPPTDINLVFTLNYDYGSILLPQVETVAIPLVDQMPTQPILKRMSPSKQKIMSVKLNLRVDTNFNKFGIYSLSFVVAGKTSKIRLPAANSF